MDKRGALFLDGSGFLHRAFHAVPERFSPSGEPVNAVEGFVSMALKPLVEKASEIFVAVVFDAPPPTFRHSLYPSYKAHRPPQPASLKSQALLCRAAARAFGLAVIEAHGFEADDLVATLCAQAVRLGVASTVVSSDKDYMQLVGPSVRMFDHRYKRMIGPEEVLAKFGVPPALVPHVQALCGDAADGIPGVPGIGIKTAGELVAAHGGLEPILAAAHAMPKGKRRDALIERAEDARLSLLLAVLRADAPLPMPFSALERSAPDLDRIRSFLSELGLPPHLAPSSSRLFPFASSNPPPSSRSPSFSPAAPPPPPPPPPEFQEEPLEEDFEEGMGEGFGEGRFGPPGMEAAEGAPIGEDRAYAGPPPWLEDDSLSA